MKNNNYLKGFGLYIVIFLAIILFIIFSKNMGLVNNTLKADYSYSKLVSDIENSSADIASIMISASSDYEGTGTAQVKFKDGTYASVDIISIPNFINIVNSSEIKIDTVNPVKDSVFISMLPTLVIVIISIVLLVVIMQQVGGGGGSKVMSFGKSKAKLFSEGNTKVTFKEVAGLDEEKEDLSEIVEFLKAPKKFTDIGARIPKGVLLVGPPGTGKTLLARAIAGEAGVPFFSISGSDFVEMFVGVGASRVRDLFEQAKKNHPCLIFIDEIDAVGRRRGAGLGGGHDEREQTLNQLLVEMDGFAANEGIIIIAATNRPDILDPALLRPGRFDRQVIVGRPDIKGREDILKVHGANKVLDESVDFKEIAKITAGFTGADLENLLNEAALLAARENKTKVDDSDVRRAFVKVGIGAEKKSRVITDKEKKMTAYHEAGHAIIFEKLPDLDPVHMISIIPTGMAGGYTMPLPSDKSYLSKKYMEQEIVSLFGGMAAEEIIYDDLTTGASNDIERATSIARSMVTKYGMSSKLGPIKFGNQSEEVFLGNGVSNSRDYGEDIAGKIDSEINAIVTKCYEKAKEILNKNMDILHATAELLIKNEKITGDEFRVLFNKEIEEL